MLNFTIKVSDSHLSSGNVSIQVEHIEAFARGRLATITVTDWDGNILKTYRGQDLADLIASAVKRGSMMNGGNVYFLAKR